MWHWLVISLFYLSASAVWFSSRGDKERLKQYVGTENRRLAAVLGVVGLIIGLGMLLGDIFGE